MKLTYEKLKGLLIKNQNKCAPIENVLKNLDIIKSLGKMDLMLQKIDENRNGKLPDRHYINYLNSLLFEFFYLACKELGISNRNKHRYIKKFKIGNKIAANDRFLNLSFKDRQTILKLQSEFMTRMGTKGLMKYAKLHGVKIRCYNLLEWEISGANAFDIDKDDVNILCCILRWITFDLINFLTYEKKIIDSSQVVFKEKVA